MGAFHNKGADVTKKMEGVTYTRYEDIDQEALGADIDAIKEQIPAPNWEDFQHLLKLERWGSWMVFAGFILTGVISFFALEGFSFWSLAFVAAFLIGAGNLFRWANVTHPILHGAYDKVPNIPYAYTKAGFARGMSRWWHWADWIKPEAWEYEHNIMHHYHLGEDEDPDNVERNMKWLTESKTPMFLRYMLVAGVAATWKFTYYAPNTLRILENKERRKRKEPEMEVYEWDPRTKSGKELWTQYMLPYGLGKFVALPLLFWFPFGWAGVETAFIVMLLSELVANVHSFIVIVPNHSAEDIYQFSKPHKSQGEFYLRQIMGSVNYNTGSDMIDAWQGFLNYQVEHHLFPNMPQSFYQKMQPMVKEICKKYDLEYRQESVFKRAWMSVELMVGKTHVLRVEGI